MSEPSESGAGLNGVRRWIAPITGWFRTVSDHLAEVATAPAYHRLRQLLLISALVQLILAPLSSWSIDTNTFVQTGSITLYTGNPYAGGTWYNAPLAPFLSVPSFAFLTAIVGPAGLFHAVPGLAGVAARTGIPTYLPTPAALLAWKLPLIIAGLAVGIAIDWALRFRLEGLSPEVGAATWLLNPVVIYAIAIHGEVDGLAALWVVLALLAFATRHWFAGGLALSLAFFTKGYPIALVPVILAWLVLTRLEGGWSARRAGARLGWAALGAAAGALPFVGYIGTTIGELTARSSIGVYGALSLTVIFNPAVPKFGGAYHAFASSPANGPLFLGLLVTIAVVGYAVGLVLFGIYLRRGPSDVPELSMAALLGAGAVAAVLLSDPIPNAENLLGVLPLVVLATPRLPRDWALRLLTGVSFAGLFQYFSILTPFASFYPAAVLLGPSAVSSVNAIVLGYLNVPGLRGFLWLMVGLIGGTFILMILIASAWYLLPANLRARRWWWRRGAEPRGAQG
jgi:hypothetical protein